MSFSGKDWIWLEQKNDQAVNLAEAINVPVTLARLLINRGIIDPEQAGVFLYPSIDHLHDPWLMKGMEDAVTSLLKAVEKDQKIVVHGDYDADGITATVILVEALRRIGGKVDYFLPSRFEEGYGLHVESLNQIKESGAGLVITVDCGINALHEVEHALSIGLDIIITDHHQPLVPIRGALAVVNPLQDGCSYPFKELSGSGVSFKLAQALMERAGLPFPERFIDLAALGTAADVVPLLGENRIIVAKGVEEIGRLNRLGFRALLEAVSLDKNRISGTSLAFILAPAVNAAGRMGEAYPSAELFLTGDPSRAAELAGQLHRVNLLRRDTEQKILAEAEEILSGISGQVAENKIIVLSGDNWHHGVIGIVASRLVDKYNLPVALIAVENGEGRGSARSVPGYNITAALAENEDLLVKFGGHEQAAGFTVKADKIKSLERNLSLHAQKNLDEKQLSAKLYLEADLNEEDFDLSLTEYLELLQPFGPANRSPVFGSREWEIISWRLVGSGHAHLKLTVQKNGRVINPIFFSGARFESDLQKGRLVDLAFRLKDGFFRDQKTLEVEIRDLGYSDTLKMRNLEIIDRRHCRKRFDCLLEILKTESGRTVVYTTTGSKAEKIIDNIPSASTPCFVNGSILNGNTDLPEKIDTLIIYDLPVHDGLKATLLQEERISGYLKVYLLFNEEDLKQNKILTDLSLPSDKILKKIVDAMVETSENAGSISVNELQNMKIGMKPSVTFWERVEKIFIEIGVLKDGFVNPDPAGLLTGLSEKLKDSPTYLSTEELRKECRRFQDVLLNGSLKEAASVLSLPYKK
ncbi:MAG: single-stranded-DNA-specific exonuclease RecJ [Bacillota bacterium]|nr:single-stranded-DNA-specific exonuclease RecJ [Bacillota bacterium]